MDCFIEKHGQEITGILSGWDRIVFRGTLRILAVAGGMMHYLSCLGVLLKNFGEHAEGMTKVLLEASLAAAKEADRPIRYLASSQTRKEDLAREIADADGIDAGLICVLKCVEPCMSYEIQRNRKEKKLILNPKPRKCLHLYHYWIDPFFGFMGARIQTWFPFSVQVWMNGREWLARKMDALGLKYKRHDNCFPWLENFARAQTLMDSMQRTNWPRALNRIAQLLNPAHARLFDKFPVQYYWSAHQTEWATDIAFSSGKALAAIYPQLVHGAMLAFSCPDVLRFLGKRPGGRFSGEVTGDYKERPEGVRIKHRARANSVKAYDKCGNLLRVETTINCAREFRSYRTAENDPGGEKKWLRMRKGVADLHRRARISQQINERYLDALASLDTTVRIEEMVKPICRPVRWKGKRVRALRPWSEADRALLQTISRGEFMISGFRNRDIAQHLYPRKTGSPEEKRRDSARVTHRLRLLRAHRLIKKIPRTRRYQITRKGREILAAILLTQQTTVQQLKKAAA